MKKHILAWQRHKILYWICMWSISWFINYLYCWIYSNYILHKNVNKTIQEPDWHIWLAFCFILKLEITVLFALIRFHSLHHLLSFAVTQCHLLSLVAISCHSLSFVLTRFHSLYHSLSLVVPLVVIPCTSRLSFYKQ